MSVILTGIDMPKSCFSKKNNCPLSNGEYGCCNYSGKIDITWDEEDGRPKDCPLRPIEGLIDDIKTIDVDYRINGHNLSVEGVIEIIKEYCEVIE